MIIAGLDPGKAGAMVRLDDQGRADQAWPAPVVGKQYDGIAISAVLDQAAPDEVWIERKNLLPKNGGKVFYAAGESWGRWSQACDDAGLSYREVTARIWQLGTPPECRRKGLSYDERKALYVLFARREAPQLPWDSWNKAVQSGVADAYWIARHGWLQSRMALPS